MAQLPVVIEMYLAILALVAGHVTDAVRCSCKPPPAHTNCNSTFEETCDVFLRDGNEGACHSFLPTSDQSQLNNFSSRVKIVGAKVIYNESCETEARCTADKDEMEDCRSFRGWTYITLDITYEIDGDGFRGVLFNLTPDSEQELVSLSKPCHYVCLDNPIRPGKFQDKQFHYTGFVGLHPGVTYNLTATSLYSASPNTTSKIVEVKNCQYEELRKQEGVCDFYCNLRTPANNSRERVMGVSPDLIAWFMVHPWEENTVTSYDFSLKPPGADKYTENVSIENVKENYTRCKDGRWKCLQHRFSRSSPGTYFVRVFAQPDSVCLNNIHWQKKCTSSRTSVIIPTARDTTPVVHQIIPSVATPVAGEASSSKIENVSIQLMLLVLIVGSISVLVSFVLFQLVRRIKCQGMPNSWIGSDSLTRVDSADEIANYVPRALDSRAYPTSSLDLPATSLFSTEVHPTITLDPQFYPTSPLKPRDHHTSLLDPTVDSTSPLNPEENHPT